MTRVVIVGGGPGGYEAALVAAQLGASVTVVDRDGLGGSCVLTDCVPSKALLATADVIHTAAASGELGVRLHGDRPSASSMTVDLGEVNGRIKRLAAAQSADIHARLEREGVEVVNGLGRLAGSSTVVAELATGGTRTFPADAILVSTGARPRVLPGAEPDGERILTWEQVYDLDHLPERLIVVGSGVTGAEFASAYHGLGSDVVLVSSREHVLPGEDQDAAQVLEDVFRSRGMHVLGRSRAVAARREAHGVVVTLGDGSEVEGTHVLMAVGSIPNTESLGLKGAGVRVNEGGYIEVDRVSRTSERSVYAAGDVTGVFMLASVAAMQGRIAMRNVMGDAVTPLDLSTVSSNVFTAPEIATVGVTQAQVDAGAIDVDMVKLPLDTNARAKMQGIHDGFVKLFSRPGTGVVVGGVVVAPKASELIYPITVAVQNHLTVDDIAASFTVYPSLTGSIAEAARQLHPTT